MTLTLLMVLGLCSGLGSEQLTSRNYQGLEEYIQGFMNGYQDKRVALPARCLNDPSKEELDEDIINVFSIILRQRWEELGSGLDSVLSDMVSIYNDCDLSMVYDNFNHDVIQNGLVSAFTNILLHFSQIEGYALESVLELVAQKPKEAGYKLGKAFELIAPIPSTLSTAPVGISPKNVTDFWSGLLDGLEGNTRNPGSCYIDLSSETTQVEACLNDFERFLNGDATALEQFLIDLELLIQSFNAMASGDCDFASLITILEHIDRDEIMANYFQHIFACTKDLNTVRACTNDYEKCGKASGELFRLLIGWSLN